jgi:hypothetical protein
MGNLLTAACIIMVKLDFVSYKFDETSFAMALFETDANDKPDTAGSFH